MSDPDPFSQCIGKYEVHPESYEFVQRVMSLGAKPYSELSVAEVRQQSARIAPELTGPTEFLGSETEIIVPSPFSTNGIPVTVYKPELLSKVPAIFIFFHGGGLVIGSRDSYSTAVRKLCSSSGAIFLNVEYRLLPDPESPMAPFEDALVVTRWLLGNKEVVGGHTQSKVGVGGDSAGGHISACVTNDICDLDFQVLVYPMTDITRSQPSFSEFTTTPGLTLDAINWFARHSIEHIPRAAENPSVNPMVQRNVVQSPPALFVLAELDALRDCGLAYADKLRKVGVPVQCHVIKGVPHAFFHLCDVFKTKTAEAYAHIADFVKQFHQ
ncbi:carboxylesterase NlhH-like [Aplysia californica]|uniref:Carboxylesterase NlhH-like n=1 Tax=Aplysia californica TaxID=6500 RepID=A0ABM0JRT0_APLCA|nr:carboxylesterase NlhH-like [Aplysia californica]